MRVREHQNVDGKFCRSAQHSSSQRGLARQSLSAVGLEKGRARWACSLRVSCVIQSAALPAVMKSRAKVTKSRSATLLQRYHL